MTAAAIMRILDVSIDLLSARRSRSEESMSEMIPRQSANRSTVKSSSGLFKAAGGA
jgi:hypothetical protein